MSADQSSNSKAHKIHGVAKDIPLKDYHVSSEIKLVHHTRLRKVGSDLHPVAPSIAYSVPAI